MSRDTKRSPSPRDHSLRTPPGSPGRPSAFHAATPQNSPQRPEPMSLIPPSINTPVERVLVLAEADFDAAPLGLENPSRKEVLSPLLFSPKASDPRDVMSSPLPRRPSTPGLAQLLAKTETTPQQKRSYTTLPPIVESDEPAPEINTSDKRAIRKIPAPPLKPDSMAEIVTRGAEPRSPLFCLYKVNSAVKEHLLKVLSISSQELSDELRMPKTSLEGCGINSVEAAEDIKLWSAFSNSDIANAIKFFNKFPGFAGVSITGCVLEPDYNADTKEKASSEPATLFVKADEQLIARLYENRRDILDSYIRSTQQKLNTIIQNLKTKTSKKAILKQKNAVKAYHAIETTKGQLSRHLEEGETRALRYLALMRKAARKTARAASTPNPTETVSTTPRSPDPKASPTADDDSIRVERTKSSSSFFIGTPPRSPSPEPKEPAKQTKSPGIFDIGTPPASPSPEAEEPVKFFSPPPLSSRSIQATPTPAENKSALQRLRAELAARRAAAAHSPTSSHGL